MNATEAERPDLAQQQQQPVTSLPSRPPSGIVAGAALLKPAVPRIRSGADAVEAARASAEFSHPQSSSPDVTPTHAQLSPSSPTQPPLIPVVQPPSLQPASAPRNPARPHPLTLPPPLASPWPLPVLRSSQLDASRLDLELASMLQEQLLSAFSLLPPGHVTDYEPELAALLRLLVFGLSVWRGQATPGSVLLNLRYRDERKAHPQGQGLAQGEWAGHAMQALGGLGGKTGVGGPGLSVAQRTALGLGMVLVPWVWARLGRWAAAHAAGGDSWGQPPAAAWRTWADPDDAATSPSSQDSPFYNTTPQPQREEQQPVQQQREKQQQQGI
ncbi:Pex12 amino terminal region-domain-containing protein [Haematococcus lacustris]